MKPIMRIGSLAVASLLLSAPPVLAQVTHSISVLLDDATSSEDDLLTAAATNLADGDAPQSIRKLASGIIGEVHVLLNQRLSGDTLALDDGTEVVVTDQDFVEVRKKKKAICKLPPCGEGEGDTNPAGAVVFFGKGRGPLTITIQNGQGCTRLISFFTKSGNGRPQIFPWDCTIPK